MKEGSLTTIAFLAMGSMSGQTTLPERERERVREMEREGRESCTDWLEWGPPWAGEIMS